MPCRVMCPDAPEKYLMGCGGVQDSIRSRARKIKIGHNLYGFTGIDNPFIDERLNQHVQDMAEHAARTQQGSGGEPEPWPFD